MYKVLIYKCIDHFHNIWVIYKYRLEHKIEVTLIYHSNLRICDNCHDCFIFILFWKVSEFKKFDIELVDINFEF